MQVSLLISKHLLSVKGFQQLVVLVKQIVKHLDLQKNMIFVQQLDFCVTEPIWYC